jgi:hypothetical protein
MDQPKIIIRVSRGGMLLKGIDVVGLTEDQAAKFTEEMRKKGFDVIRSRDNPISCAAIVEG